MAFERVCVYAGSTPGADPAYAAAARQLGTLLAQRGIGVVYGGGRVGLMGAVADAALAAGGEVIGVLPQSLDDREIGHTGLTELRVVASMHERKALMAELAGAFVALPGGLGTIEELVEAATWTQLGIHVKPVGLLDVGGYWRPLEALLDHAVQERFLRVGNRALVVSGSDPASLLDTLEDWQSPDGSTTLDREQAQVLIERDAPTAHDPAGATAPKPVALGAPRIGVGAFVVRDGRLLLGLRRGAHGSGTWSAPGGALEAGEEPAAAALRELREETGLRGAAATPIGVTNDVFAADGQHWVTLHMLVDDADGEPSIREPQKCERLEWFDLDALPQPLFAPLQALLDGGWRGPGR